MRDWWIKLGCFLTGWNYDILKNCTEASRKKLKKYTSAILILIIIWSFVGFSFAQNYLQAGTIKSVCIAVIFVIIVIQIERQIILNMGKNGWSNTARIIIAIIMALLGSVILDQIIFKDDIEKEKIAIIDEQVNSQIGDRTRIISEKIKELRNSIDSIELRNQELNKEIASRPVIYMKSRSVTHVVLRNDDGTITNEPQYTFNETPIENPRKKEVEMNEKLLESQRKSLQEYNDKMLSVESDLRNELKAKKGFLEELNAMIKILSKSFVALIFYLILLLFFIFLELFVVFSKTDKTQSDYDLIMEHQLNQKKLMLEKLVSDS